MRFLVSVILCYAALVQSNDYAWRQIHPRIRSDSKFPQKYEFHPTSRKGSSAVNIAGKVYVFGGFAKLPNCMTTGNIEQENCSEPSFEYSNELWKFDPVDSTWELLIPKNGIQPEGREQHSATVLSDNRMLVFGGRSRLKDPGNGTSRYAYLSDVWLLDVGRITKHTFRHSEERVEIPEGKFLRKNLIIDVEKGEDVGTEDLCVDDVKVRVSISHPCTRQLSLSLYGPQGNQVELYPLDTDSNCKEDLKTTTFSDSAEISILDYYSANPYNGSFRPSSSLSFTFRNSPINGNWTLEVYDSEVDLKNGSLDNWDLKISASPCKTSYQWKHIPPSQACEKATMTLASDGNGFYQCLSSPDIFEGNHWPSPRYGHSSIVVNDSVFILGGCAGRSLNEVWRYDYKAGSWYFLSESHHKSSSWSGKSAVLTPDGMYTAGGINGMNDASQLNSEVLKYDVVSSKWMLISNTVKTSLLSPRYQSTLTLIGLPEIDSARFTFPYLLDVPRKPTLLMFGGNPGIPSQTYLNDIWALQINPDINSISEDIKVDRCKTILDTASLQWNQTCGSITNTNETKNLCSWTDIVTMAWCLEQYQSFTSPA